MDNGIVHVEEYIDDECTESLNPCCSGQWYRTSYIKEMVDSSRSLNPCCSGQWYRTLKQLSIVLSCLVLILVVVDNGIVPHENDSDC